MTPKTYIFAHHKRYKKRNRGKNYQKILYELPEEFERITRVKMLKGVVFAHLH